MDRAWIAIAAAALGCAAGSAQAQGAEESPPPVTARYTVDLLSDIDGGADRGTGLLGRFDLAYDSRESFLGIKGAQAHFDLMLLHGSRFSSRYAGDAQTLSNIDAPRAIRPFEAWIEAPIGRNLRAKAGLIDLNSEFDVQSVGARFLNSSFGIAPDFSQSGLNGPSIFPVTSSGLVVKGEDRGRTLALGIFDALPGDPDHPHRFLPGRPGRDGALLVAEGGLPLGSDGQLQLGAWRYTARFDRIDGAGRASSGGAYVQLQGSLAGKEDATLRGWLRTGVASSRTEAIGLYVGGGLTFGGEDHMVGIGVAHARLGDTALDAGIGDRRAETAFELTAYHRLSRHVAIQPDVQYIRHPSWQSSTPDALVAGVRLHLEFGLGN